MQIVDVTCRGDLSVADHLAAMRSRRDDNGAEVTKLHAVRIVGDRITFTAVFEQSAEADRFREAFNEP